VNSLMMIVEVVLVMEGQSQISILALVLGLEREQNEDCHGEDC